jgi:pimeloyl-ACP methyl ester carboxylesterase
VTGCCASRVVREAQQSEQVSAFSQQTGRDVNAASRDCVAFFTFSDTFSDMLPGAAMIFPVTEQIARTSRHTSFYLAAGAADGIPLIFVHGWPELSISWRHQLACFASLGFRAIAPDMRGYGRSSIYTRYEDYALEHAVTDMLELLDSLGRDRALWVGHDWGSPVVWSIASHFPDRCYGVANLCVPYVAAGFAPRNLIPLVAREIYPESEYPAGQWEYQLFYEQDFDKARKDFEANVANTVKALFRKGDPRGRHQPSRTAFVRKRGGWFGDSGQAPERPLDTDVISESEFHTYVAALERNGFFGPNSWYMNHERNVAFAARSVNNGRIDLPVLFVHALYDYTCETVDSRLAEPMRQDCTDVAEVVVSAGHWIAQEKPTEVNAALARWLATRVPDLWPVTSFTAADRALV